MTMKDNLQEEYNVWLQRIGRTVASIRKEQNLTQSQMAEKTGFDLKYYQDIEYGRRPITTRTLYQLCIGIEVEIHDLIVRANK